MAGSSECPRREMHALPLNAYIVEDNPALRASLCEALLELAGIVTCGQSGRADEAIAWLGDPVHAWDLAIVDLVLEPGGSGLQVLRALAGRPPGRKVVVLTATAHPDVRRECRALGSGGVFDKAMETEALLDWCVRLAGPRPPDAMTRPGDAGSAPMSR